MIYSLSTGAPIVKAYKGSARQVSPETLIQTLPLDPTISSVDIVVLGVKDFGGFKGKNVLEAIQKRHKSITAVLLFDNEKTLKGLPENLNMQQVKVTRFTDVAVKAAIDEVIQKNNIHSKETEVLSNDEVERPRPEELAEAIISNVVTIQPVIQQVVYEEEMEEESEIETLINNNPPAEVERVMSIEERVGNLNIHADFQSFQHSMKKENMVRELIQENTRYGSAMQMLDTLDREIISIFRSETESAETKFSEIRNVAYKRIGYKEVINNILIEKVNKVILAVIASAENSTEQKLVRLRESLDKVEKSGVLYRDRSQLDKIIRERLELQMELTEAIEKVMALFNLIENTGKEIIESLDEGIPSDNDYVNAMLSHSGTQFKTENSAELTNKILDSIAGGRVRLSSVENQLQRVVHLVFTLCDKDNTLIEYQQNLINLLSSQRVEDVVIVDTILKSCLRVFIGPDNIGTRTTAITWAGLQARRNNSLLIDLSGKPKFKDYGIEPVKLVDFLNERIQKQFLCVEGTVQSRDELRDALAELKTRLNYYPHVSVILSSEQMEYLDEIKMDTLTVHFVTDASARSLAIMKGVVSRFDATNIAKKLILIDPPIDPVALVNKVGVDPLSTRLIIIPRIPKIQALSLVNEAPFNDADISLIFEEAFR